MPSFKNLIETLAFDGLNDTFTEVVAAEMLDEDVIDVLVRLLRNMFTKPNGKSIILREAEVNDAETS